MSQRTRPCACHQPGALRPERSSQLLLRLDLGADGAGRAGRAAKPASECWPTCIMGLLQSQGDPLKWVVSFWCPFRTIQEGTRKNSTLISGWFIWGSGRGLTHGTQMTHSVYSCPIREPQMGFSPFLGDPPPEMVVLRGFTFKTTKQRYSQKRQTQCSTCLDRCSPSASTCHFENHCHGQQNSGGHRDGLGSSRSFNKQKDSWSHGHSQCWEF